MGSSSGEFPVQKIPVSERKALSDPLPKLYTGSVTREFATISYVRVIVRGEEDAPSYLLLRWRRAGKLLRLKAESVLLHCPHNVSNDQKRLRMTAWNVIEN